MNLFHDHLVLYLMATNSGSIS